MQTSAPGCPGSDSAPVQMNAEHHEAIRELGDDVRELAARGLLHGPALESARMLALDLLLEIHRRSVD